MIARNEKVTNDPPKPFALAPRSGERVRVRG
jgi:hypothetical protein